MLDKQAQDLQSDIVIDEDDGITGTLNNIDSWNAFNTDPSDNTGNFLALYFPEALNGEKITCEIKGTGAVVKKPVQVDTSDGLIVLHIHNSDNTIEVVSEGKTTRTLKCTQLKLQSIPGV